MKFHCIFSLVFFLSTFLSLAEVRLLTGDANNNLYDRDAGILDLSADGKLVLFVSGPPSSGSPPPGIAQGGLYVRNIEANTLTFTGATNVGAEGSMSDNGRYVSWTSPQNLIFWRDTQGNETRSITAGADGACRNPILSADGRYVAYVSVARNLVANTNQLPASGRAAVYLYDSQSQTTTVASLSYQGNALTTGVGSTAPQLEFDFSADGRYVFFSTDSTNMHPLRSTVANQAYFWLYRRNVTNGVVDVVCKNATNGIPTTGNFASPRCDATGNRIVFTGGFVAFLGGPTLIPGYTGGFGTDYYLKDMTSNTVWWVTKTTNNTTPDASYLTAAINSNGTVVAFGSTGTKFVPEQTDPPPSSDSFDIFRVDIGPDGAVTNTLITKALFGTNNVGFFNGPFLPGTGNYVAFNTRYLYSLLGERTDNSVWYHGVASGTFPAHPPAAAPSPQITFSANQVTISWSNAPGFNLVFKTNVAETNWSLVPNSPTLSNGVNHISLPPTGTGKFFRIQSQ